MASLWQKMGLVKPDEVTPPAAPVAVQPTVVATRIGGGTSPAPVAVPTSGGTDYNKYFDEQPEVIKITI